MPKLPRPLVWILWLLALALLARTVPRDRGVIIDHIEFGRRVAAGENPYATFETPRRNAGPLHTPYPPSYGVFTAPLSLVPQVVARTVWGVLQLAALWGLGWAALWWWRRLSEHPATAPPSVRHWSSVPHWVLVAVAILLSRYILRDTHGGGGNSINAALAFCGFTLAEAGRPRCAGLLVGLSIATKPTQLLVLLLLAVHRRSTAVAWTLAVAGAMAVVAWARVGAEPWSHWLEGSWAYGSAVDIYATPSHGFPPFTWMNQCLRCMVYRVLATTPPEFALELAGESADDFQQGLGLPLTTVATVAKAANAVLLAGTAGLAWRARHTALGRWLAACLLLVVSLLLSPITWKAHHVALAPALFAIVHGSRPIAWAILALYIPSCVIGEELLGAALKNRMQSWYLVTIWDLVFFGWLAVALWREGRPLNAFARSGRPLAAS